MRGAVRGLLDPEALARIQARLRAGHFADGRKTAGFRARSVKRNEQLRKSTDDRELDSLVTEALESSAPFRAIAVPRFIHKPLFSRYTAGMTYGDHVDDALMDWPDPLRTDVAVTVFLSEPESYVGGELVVESTFGEQRVKLPAGDAIVYPASSLHRVAPVTGGVRLAAVTWVQSFVRDPGKRDVLLDLDQVRTALHARAPAAPETDLAFKTYSNLLRLWSET